MRNKNQEKKEIVNKKLKIWTEQEDEQEILLKNEEFKQKQIRTFLGKYRHNRDMIGKKCGNKRKINSEITDESLETKLPTIWTDGKAQPRTSSDMEKVKRGEKKRDGEDQTGRKSEETSCRCAKR